MKKLLITGCNGFLGQRLCAHYEEKYDVIAIGHQDLDICREDAVQNLFREVRPDIVFHTAAISDTGYSQNHPEESYQVNTLGSVHIALACREQQAQLVYMSSDQVYNGNVGLQPWKETDEVNPQSVYGRDKLEAEKRIAEILPEAVGLRLTWMYDLPDSPRKLNRNLPVNLLQAFQKREKLKAAVREYRGITNVWEVVRNMEACLDIPGGAYNFGSMNDRNSYETFIRFAELMQLPEPSSWILADEERFPEHPRNLMIDNQKAAQVGISFQDTIEGFAQCLQEKKHQ